MQTHETYIQAVAELALNRLDTAERAKFKGVKMVYGAGQKGIMGITMYNRWNAACGTKSAFIEIAAFTHRSWAELIDTVIHEVGHAIAGHQAAHEKDWKAACERLGLRTAKAVGRSYMARLAPDLRMAIAALPLPTDGLPETGNLPSAPNMPLPPRPGCTVGIGSRGGKSRGPGSGSRLRLFMCEGIEHKPVKVRVSADEFHAQCTICNTAFRKG